VQNKFGFIITVKKNKLLLFGLNCWIISTEILSEELKHDLKVTVDGLNSYLSSVQANADRHREQFATVVQERAQLMQRMKEMEPMTELVHHQQSEITALRQVCVNSVTVCSK